MSYRKRRYTDAEKAAYYRKQAYQLALQGQGAYYRPRLSRARVAYAPRTIKGRGAYKAPTPKKNKGSSRPLSTAAGSALGGALGSVFGPGGTAVGTALGGLAGNTIGEIMGWGAYDIRRNTVMGKISEGTDPARMHTAKSELVVAHREYITDIISSSSANTFNLQAFPINPGLIQSFPWLSAIATQFEEYDLLGMVFEFKTLSADAIANTTNTALGYVVMATDYNSINPNFVNKQQMENTEYTTSCKPSLSMYHPIECDPGLNPLSKLYVRSGAVPTGSDQRLYDLGIFQIATSCPGTSVVLGELWVSYEVCLKKPISTNALNQDVLTDHYKLGTAWSAGHPLGTAPVLSANSSIGGTINAAGTIYSFPSVYQEGTYLITYQVTGVSTAVTQPSITLTNASFVTLFDNGSNEIGTPNGTTTTAMIIYWVINITAQNASITFGTAGTLPATPANGDFAVTQWDSNVVT